ncbi:MULTISPECIES: hypothetical protein [unclassified Calothrix]|uniref:hypothetical protein n=1 Tax=unclassified Calothrix TaxID=2619626 RepID=UPI001F5575BB|nr:MULTISPECIES: hypothetical protein [unclassified Calothrix]
MKNSKTRRNFLLTTVAMASGIVGADTLTNNTSGTALATMPERILGRTGVKVPILGLKIIYDIAIINEFINTYSK